jgi:hypothetical protein
MALALRLLTVFIATTGFAVLSTKGCQPSALLPDNTDLPKFPLTGVDMAVGTKDYVCDEDSGTYV